VDEEQRACIKKCWAQGVPGSRKWVYMGLPKKLLEKGITDMVRISDAG
jgi:dihydroxy-acid dehydratase/L-arabonate dehydrase